MKFLTSLVALVALPTIAVVTAYDATYHDGFEDPNGSLYEVACSDGINGLLTRGFSTYGSLPSFPYIGSAPQVTEWNSPVCGTCWKLTYSKTGRSIYMLAIDMAETYDLSYPAMDDLTAGQAYALGRVKVTANQVASSFCGMY